MRARERTPAGIFFATKSFTFSMQIIFLIAIMNMKKTLVVSVSALLMSLSAFAWTKTTEGEGNLGRMFVSVDGGAQFNKYKNLDGEKFDKVSGVAAIEFNVPVFKPGVNAFKDISWMGVDLNAAFNFAGGDIVNGASLLSYGVQASAVPYLNFETGWKYFQAIKPFAFGRAGYLWNEYGNDFSSDQNYFTYGFGGGVEFVVSETFSVTGVWAWNGNAESGVPIYQTVGAEATYWANSMMGFSIFAEHNFGADYSGFEHKHGDTFGVKFKIGFAR